MLIFYGCICRLSCFWHSVRGIVFNHSTMFSRPHLMVIVFFSINRYQPIDLVLLRRKNNNDALVSQVLREQYNYVFLSKVTNIEACEEIQSAGNTRLKQPTTRSPFQAVTSLIPSTEIEFQRTETSYLDSQRSAREGIYRSVKNGLCLNGFLRSAATSVASHI